MGLRGVFLKVIQIARSMSVAEYWRSGNSLRGRRKKGRGRGGGGGGPPPPPPPPPVPNPPPLFPFLPIPYPLPLSTPATQATVGKGRTLSSSNKQ